VLMNEWSGGPRNHVQGASVANAPHQEDAGRGSLLVHPADQGSIAGNAADANPEVAVAGDDGDRDCYLGLGPCTPARPIGRPTGRAKERGRSPDGGRGCLQRVVTLHVTSVAPTPKRRAAPAAWRRSRSAQDSSGSGGRTR
jgi:hypothetical protein